MSLCILPGAQQFPALQVIMLSHTATAVYRHAGTRLAYVDVAPRMTRPGEAILCALPTGLH